MARAVSGTCKHARVALEALDQRKEIYVIKVNFGEQGAFKELWEAVTEAADKRFLSVQDKRWC